MRTMYAVGLLGAAAFMAVPAGADLIYESATMGEPGWTIGLTLADFQFAGSRFTIDETTQITAIGGHLASSGTLFGCIVGMDGQLPMGSPFTNDEILATAVFDAGPTSTDYRTDLSVVLEPGDYSLVFGAGMLGATGQGWMPYFDQTDTPDGAGSYFMWSGDDTMWRDLSGRSGLRFVVEGHVVPAPSALALFGLAALGGGRRRN